MIGQRRQGQIDALASIALALPVQRLVLTELLEQHHGQQVRSGMAARDGVEWRRRLGHRLARPAREALAHRLDHLPLARDHLQRLGDILSELHQPAGTAARAALRCGDDDTLTPEMIRERLACWTLTLEGREVGRPRRGFRGQLVLGGGGLQVLELHLQLIEEARLALRAHAVELAPELLDLELQPCDQHVRAAVGCALSGDGRLGFQPRATLRQDHGVGRGKVARKGIHLGRHRGMESYPPSRRHAQITPMRQVAMSSADAASRCLPAGSRAAPA